MGPNARLAPGHTLSRLFGAPKKAPPPSFVAIDFETATPQRDSACAVAWVRVDDGKVTDKRTVLIRPPENRFEAFLVDIHRVTPRQVRSAPSFIEVFPHLALALRGAAFCVAHNAPFDRSVLSACCARAGLPDVQLPWLCTAKLAKRVLDLPRGRLPDVCRALGIPLRHHDPLSDALACTQIALSLHLKLPSGLQGVVRAS